MSAEAKPPFHSRRHPGIITEFREGFGRGYTAITEEQEREWSVGVDFGIRVMTQGEAFEETSSKETAWVLMEGKAEIEWPGGRAVVTRDSLFDEEPTCLHVPAHARVRIHAMSSRVEWSVSRATNSRQFAPKLFSPQEVSREYRGKGLAQGACLRNVRLVFDYKMRPESNLVIGEVINFAGKWSSYPPHHHAQPELYHYRFTMPQGYGHAELGEDVFKVRSGDTLKILSGMDHSQTSAPGYGMYYLWVVRHLDKNPYEGFEFTPEHEWLLDPKNQGWEPNV